MKMKDRPVRAALSGALRLLAAIILVGLTGSRVAAQQYLTLSDFKAGGGEALIGPIDADSVTGYFSAVERFSFVDLNPQIRALAEGASIGAAFQAFSDEARQTVDGVPFPSGSTSVVYAFDDKLETFVRLERPLAPSLSQNARTNGRRVLTIGTAYSYVDYSHFNDDNLRQVNFSAGNIPVTFFDGSPGVARDVLLSEVNLKEHVYAFSVQFGILDNLDIGAFVPVIDLRFRGNAIDRFFLEDSTGTLTPSDVSTDSEGNCCIFTGDPNVPTYSNVSDVDRRAFADVLYPGIRFRQDKVGVGDVQFRVKYFFGSDGPADVGLLFNTIAPTGDEDNLLGVGAWRLEPRMIVSTSHGRVGFHVNAGYHADLEEHDRDRVDYSAGAEIMLAKRVALLVDHVARLGIAGTTRVRKFEIVPGIKVNAFKDAVVGFNAIVPLNREGLTTDFTPNGLVDVTFVF
jgi:hypothetical protein